MSLYPPDGWVVVTGAWNSELTHSATGGWNGGAYLQFNPSGATAAEIESESFFPVIKSRYYDVCAMITATGTSNLGTHQIFVDWYDDSESSVSTTTVATVTIGTGHTTFSREGSQVQAPSTAVLAKVRLKQNVDTSPTANVVRVHDVSFTLAPVFWQASRVTSNQSVNDTTTTDIVFNNSDVANGCSLATGTGIVTVTEPGCYYITAAAGVSSLDDGKYATIGISKNGGTMVQGTQIPGGAALTHVVTVAVMLRLAAQDTVRVQVYHNHGSARDVLTGATNTYFHGVRCGM